MPRRHRERILEITKTVTVTEVVNNSTRCHPGTCEVTVTNLDSGSGHPVSVNISHLHETVCHENESGRCSPIVHVHETVHEKPSTATEEINTCIERILRVETEGDVTFKQRGDNVIDLSFTTPVKPVVYSEINSPQRTLYYHSFEKETASNLVSPDSAVSDSPKRYMRSDDSDSDSGSLIIHSPIARPDSGVSSSVQRILNEKNLSTSVGSSEEEDLQFQEASADLKKNERLPYYIVTSMSETVNSSQLSPNTTTCCAHLDTSTDVTTTMNDMSNANEAIPRHPKRESSGDGKEKRRSILVVTNVSATSQIEHSEQSHFDYSADSGWNDILPAADKRRRITMEVLFTPPTPKENGAPPKPPRRTKYGPLQLVERVQHYECSLDELSDGPNMTSTPISTLERHGRKHTAANVAKDSPETEKSASQDETPIMTSRKISKPPALTAVKSDTNERQPLASPRRSPSSPIIVVNQDRRNSMDLLVPSKQPRRKSTITDIDWFAAFNMKEPTTSKSPRSPIHVDALREVENAMNDRKKNKPVPYETTPLAPSKIDLNDVFTCTNSTKKEDEKCHCNACVLMKMSEEELKVRYSSLRRSPPSEKRQFVARSLSLEERRRKAPYADSDISIEDIFSPPKKEAKQINQNPHYYTENLGEERGNLSVESSNPHDSITEFHSSENQLNPINIMHSITTELLPNDISLDDIFAFTTVTEPHKEEFLDTTVEHHKKPSSYEIVKLSSPSSRTSVQFDAISHQSKESSSYPSRFMDTDLGLDKMASTESRAEIADTTSTTQVNASKGSVVGDVQQHMTPATSIQTITSDTIFITELPVSDISMDDIFTPQSSQKTTQLEKNVHKPDEQKESLTILTNNAGNNAESLSKPSIPASEICLDDVFSPTKEKKDKIPEDTIEQYRHQQCESQADNEPLAVPPDLNWLEELLTPNLTPNEEELNDTVKKLYSDVIGPLTTDREIASPIFKDITESGYTSLDRSKSIGSPSRDASLSDSHFDLDTVFSQLRVDNKVLDAIEMTTKGVDERIKETPEIVMLKDFPERSTRPSTTVVLCLDDILPSNPTTAPELATTTLSSEKQTQITFEDTAKLLETTLEKEFYIISSEEYQDLKQKKTYVKAESRIEIMGGHLSPTIPVDLDNVVLDASRCHIQEEPSVEEESNYEQSSQEPNFSWINSILTLENSDSANEQSVFTLPEVSHQKGVPVTAVSVQEPVEDTRKMENQVKPSSIHMVKKAEHKSISLDWIERMLLESQNTISDNHSSQQEKDLTSLNEEVPELSDLLSLVFESTCSSPNSGKKCVCSASQLAQMSPEELKHLWEKVKKKQALTISPSAGTDSKSIISNDERLEAFDASISLDDVFTSSSPEEEKKEKHIDFVYKPAFVELDNEIPREMPVVEPVVEQKDDVTRSSTSADAPALVTLDDIFPAANIQQEKSSISTEEYHTNVVTTNLLPMKKVNPERRHSKDQPTSAVIDSGFVEIHHGKDRMPPYHEVTTHQPASTPSLSDDAWIQDVIKNGAAEVDEPDTFEASYLQSIKESEKKNVTINNSYDNYYREETDSIKNTHGRRHVDDYYDEPEDEDKEIEEIDIGDLVDGILSLSLNEASFQIASQKYSRENSHHTDTSVDRQHSQQNQPAMYLSTAASDNRMESILSYPPSTSSPTTPHMPDVGEKFVSEASMVLSNPSDDDYIIRLVFANQKTEQETTSLPPALSDTVIIESEVVTPSESLTSYTTTQQSRIYEKQRPNWMNQRSMSKTDEEVLEVEVNQEHFVIKGNYSIVISKHDPLGLLLSELTTGSTALDFSVTPKIRRLLLQCLKEKARPHIGKSLSSRAKDILYRTDPAYEVFYQMQTNRFTPSNPMGNINLCTAENTVCNEFVEERFRRSPELFVPEYKHIVHYGPPGGYPEIKTRLCEYLKEEYSADVDESRIVLLPSGNATYDLVCHCLFDSDDVILTNAPTYSRNFVNVSERAQCLLAPVNFDLSNPCINIADFEKVYEERTNKGENVKAIVVINPHNPLGIVFSIEDLKNLANWAEARGLWFIVDESFSQCIHDPTTKFESFLKLQMILSTKSVWFWSLSKDFGLPGVKLSIVQTNDRDLHNALSQLELTEPVSALAQDFVSNFLSDRDWLDKFKNDKAHRLRAHYKFVTDNLKNLGISYQPATAGIFVFVDFSKKLSSLSDEAETELWKSLAAKGIFMTPGSHTKCPQPGWMRMVFACDKRQLCEGFRRFYEFFDSPSSIVGEINY